MFGFLKRHWLGTSMAAVAIVVAAAILVWFVWSDTNDTSETNRSDIGAGVTVVDGTPPDGLTAVEANDQSVPLENDHVTSLMPMIDISPGGALNSPITLQFELDQSPADTESVFVAMLPEDTTEWTYLPAEVSADSRYVTVETDHLSNWWSFSIDWDGLLDNAGQEVLDSLTGGLTEHAEHPECENEDAAREDGYTIDSSAKDTLYWCFGIEDDQRVLKVTNRMSYPLMVDHPGLTVKEQSPMQLELQQLARIGSDEQSLLLPYETIVYSTDLQAGASAEISTEFSPAAQWLHEAEAVVRMVVSMGGMLGGKAVAPWTGLSFVLEQTDCYNAYETGDMGDFIFGCLHLETILSLVGPAGMILSAFVLSGTFIDWAIDKVRSRGAANGDQDSYQVWIEREELAPCLTAEEFMEAFRQVHIDGFYQLEEPIICEDGWAYAGVRSFLGHPDDWYEGTTEYSDPAHTVFHLEDGVWVLKRYGGTGTEWVEYYPECLEYPASLFEQMCHDE